VHLHGDPPQPGRAVEGERASGGSPARQFGLRRIATLKLAAEIVMAAERVWGRML